MQLKHQKYNIKRGTPPHPKKLEDPIPYLSKKLASQSNHVGIAFGLDTICVCFGIIEPAINVNYVMYIQPHSCKYRL